MNPPDKQADEIFANAAEITDTVARKQFLDCACAGNNALRAEVESLLAANSAAGDFLNQGPTVSARAAQKTMPIPTLSEMEGARIGRYKLLERIGEGGFGVVWMAEQEEPVRRRVALKIIKLGMDTKAVVARFEAERQALAMMDHPNIASVLDGGSTDTGRPYFVMELVKGLPITEYCDANKLNTAQRLELFTRVCQAVQHAHQKGIIHRDIKPSNILVTQQDDRPVPKVIDFGIAKATQARLTEKTLFTGLQQWIGTPAYMSPEQAGLASLDVDTRSDVYSLGVLLYELLTGHTPFDTRKLLEKGYDAVMRSIREEEPPKPSTRLSTLQEEELTVIATKRHADPDKLNRLVRGDLDWIVMKAMEKDRKRRYESASNFAKDIQAYLQQKPVSAAAPSFGYVSGKFVRRNRARLAFASLMLVSIGLALAGGKFALNYRAARNAFQATGTNAVFAAARSDDVATLNRLLDANPALVNQRDWEGATPLFYAAGSGRTNALRLLLARGADVNATNNSRASALLQSALKGHDAVAAALLDAGANPNLPDATGGTPLIAASFSGDTNIGRALLARGVSLGALQLPARLTALHIAAGLGHAAYVEMLLAGGAQVDARNVAGATPLHSAAQGMTGAGMIEVWSRGSASNQLSQFASNMPPSFLRGGGGHARAAELLLAHHANLEAIDTNRCTPLHIAAMSTNRDVARVLIAHRANLDACARDGSTPLNLAAVQGDDVFATVLLEAGANPNLPDTAGYSPLNTAIEQYHPSVAKVLLAHKADPNLARPNGQTPLHTAAGHGDADSMRLLLDAGAALHPLDPAGTPLTAAVMYHETNAVKFLLQRGAQPDVGSPQDGMDSLNWAAMLGHPDLVKLLLEFGAPVNASLSRRGGPLHAAAGGHAAAHMWLANAFEALPKGSKKYEPVLGSDADFVAVIQILLAAKANVNAREPNFERTPIFIAVRSGNADAVELLLDAGADLRVVDRVGLTPLHAASEMEANAGAQSNIVSRLLRAGAPLGARDSFSATPLHAAANGGRVMMAAQLLDAGASINSVGPNLCTPLQLAVARGRRDVASLLLAKHADTEWQNSQGTTALIEAVGRQARNLVELLLEHGAEVDGPSANGVTPLMVAAGVDDVATMKLLLERGAKVEATTKDGFTPLLCAAQAGKVESARLLLECGAKTDAVESTGATALITAASNGQLGMVKFLVELGEKLETRNKSGFTALHQAADHGHTEVVELLLGRGAEVDSLCNYPSTPLSSAANGVFTNELRYVATIKVLLAHGANVNAKVKWNQTPLHRAAEWGRPQIMKALLDAGADASARDVDGKTALDVATAYVGPQAPPTLVAGRKACAKLLQETSSNPAPGSNKN